MIYLDHHTGCLNISDNFIVKCYKLQMFIEVNVNIPLHEALFNSRKHEKLLILKGKIFIELFGHPMHTAAKPLYSLFL